MIKNTIKDPLQEEMLVKKFNEECAKVEASPYGFGEAAAMIYEAEVEQAWNALMEQVGIAELKYYNEYGMLLNLNEQDGDTEAKADEGGDKPSIKDKAAGAVDAAKNKAGELADAAKEKAGAAATAAKAAGSAFVKRVLEILEKIRVNIQKLWKAAVEKFKEFDVANKAFIARYKVALLGMKDKSFKLDSGTKFKDDDFRNAFETLKNSEGTIEKIVSIGASEESSPKKLCQELFKTETIDEYINQIVTKGPIERSVGDAFKGLESFGNAIVGADKIEAQTTATINAFKQAMTKEDAHGNANMKGTLIKAAAGWCSRLSVAYSNALKAKVLDDKQICKTALGSRVDAAKEKVSGAGQAVKNAVTGKNKPAEGEEAKPAAQGESATFNSMSVNSILESVNFA